MAAGASATWPSSPCRSTPTGAPHRLSTDLPWHRCKRRLPQPAQISASCSCKPANSGVASSSARLSKRCASPLAGHTSTACWLGISNQLPGVSYVGAGFVTRRRQRQHRPSAASSSTASRFSAQSRANCPGLSRRSGGNRSGARASTGAAASGAAGMAETIAASPLDSPETISLVRHDIHLRCP